MADRSRKPMVSMISKPHQQLIPRITVDKNAEIDNNSHENNTHSPVRKKTRQNIELYIYIYAYNYMYVL
jgi:hypothetical protein